MYKYSLLCISLLYFSCSNTISSEEDTPSSSSVASSSSKIKTCDDLLISDLPFAPLDTINASVKNEFGLSQDDLKGHWLRSIANYDDTSNIISEYSLGLDTEAFKNLRVDNGDSGFETTCWGTWTFKEENILLEYSDCCAYTYSNGNSNDKIWVDVDLKAESLTIIDYKDTTITITSTDQSIWSFSLVNEFVIYDLPDPF